MDMRLIICLAIVLCCIFPASSRTANGQCMTGLSEVQKMFNGSSCANNCSDLVTLMIYVVGTITNEECGDKKPIEIMVKLREIYDDFKRMKCLQDSKAMSINACAVKCAVCFAPIFEGHQKFNCGRSWSTISSAMLCLENAKPGCQHMGKLKTLLKKAASDMC